MRSPDAGAGRIQPPVESGRSPLRAGSGEFRRGRGPIKQDSDDFQEQLAAKREALLAPIQDARLRRERQKRADDEADQRIQKKNFKTVVDRSARLETDRKNWDKTVTGIETARKKSDFQSAQQERERKRLEAEAQEEALNDLEVIRRKIRESEEDVSLESLERKMNKRVVIEDMDAPDGLSGKMNDLKRAEVPQPVYLPTGEEAPAAKAASPKPTWGQRWESFKNAFWGRKPESP